MRRLTGVLSASRYVIYFIPRHGPYDLFLLKIDVMVLGRWLTGVAITIVSLGNDDVEVFDGGKILAR